MNMDMGQAFDSMMDGTKEIAETAHAKTKEFHESYVSKIVPDCGKYGDAAKFVAEMLPGVAEYNAIREGDWQAFAISAGIDVATLAVGVLTAGAGVAAIKGGSAAARAGVKTATKELVEAGAKKAVREVAEAGAEKAVKEFAEAGVEKAVKEAAEAGIEKAAKEVAEAGAEKVAKEVAEAGVEKAAKEVAENGIEKATKELAEAGAEKAAKEVAESGAQKTAKEIVESGAEKAAKEVDEVGKALKNKLEGLAREKIEFEKLISEFNENQILREQYIRNKAGEIIKDVETGAARRIDFIVTEGDKVIKSIEVTSKTADKTLQMAKEARILETAKEMGGAFIKDLNTGRMYEFAEGLKTIIERFD